MTMHTFAIQDDHFPGINVANVYSANNIEGATLGCQQVSITQASQNQRSYTMRIATPKYALLRNRDDRLCAIDLA